MMGTVPNFNYADRIQMYLNADGEDVLEELKDFRASHPKKFLAALRWAVGAKSETFKQLDRLTKPERTARR
jgi:hypothetical protein